MAVKAVKFRVDVVLDGEGSALETAQGPWKVTLQMQQGRQSCDSVCFNCFHLIIFRFPCICILGSNSSFQIIGNQFKTSWELDK